MRSAATRRLTSFVIDGDGVWVLLAMSPIECPAPSDNADSTARSSSLAVPPTAADTRSAIWWCTWLRSWNSGVISRAVLVVGGPTGVNWATTRFLLERLPRRDGGPVSTRRVVHSR